MRKKTSAAKTLAGKSTKSRECKQSTPREKGGLLTIRRRNYLSEGGQEEKVDPRNHRKAKKVPSER